MIGRLNHVAITVRDIRNAADFTKYAIQHGYIQVDA